MTYLDMGDKRGRGPPPSRSADLRVAEQPLSKDMVAKPLPMQRGNRAMGPFGEIGLRPGAEHGPDWIVTNVPFRFGIPSALSAPGRWTH